MSHRTLIVLLWILTCSIGCEHERGIVFIHGTDIRHPWGGENNPGRHRIVGIIIVKSLIVDGHRETPICSPYRFDSIRRGLPVSELVTEGENHRDFDGTIQADYYVFGCATATECTCPEEGNSLPSVRFNQHATPDLVRGGRVFHMFLADACVEHVCPADQTCELRNDRATCVDPVCVGFPCDGELACVADSGRPRCVRADDATTGADASFADSGNGASINEDASSTDSSLVARDAAFFPGDASTTAVVTVTPLEAPCASCNRLDLRGGADISVFHGQPIANRTKIPGADEEVNYIPRDRWLSTDSGVTPLTDASVLETTSASTAVFVSTSQRHD